MVLQGSVSRLPVQGSPFGNLKTVHKHNRKRPRRPKGRAPIFFESFWFVCLVSEHEDAKEMKKLFPRINKKQTTGHRSTFQTLGSIFNGSADSLQGRRLQAELLWTDGDELNFKVQASPEKRQHEKLISKLFFFPMTNGHESLLILVLLFLTAVPGFVSCRCSHLAASPRLKRQVWQLNRLNRSGKIKRSSN